MAKPHLLFLLASLAVAGCDRGSETFTGYVEGDFARPAPIASGRLQSLAVQRGDRVKAGAVLYALDDERERAARDLAAAQLAQSRATLANLLVGKRPEEIDEIRAQKKQADARLTLAEATLKRQRELVLTNVVSKQRLDDALAEERAARAQVRQLTAALTVAALPARKNEILAAEAQVSAAEAELRQAQWQLDQRRVTAAADARVEDSFFRVGEFVPAAVPVLSLLPDGNIFIKFYVPQKALPHMAPGTTVEIRCDGCAAPVRAKVRFIAREAEYTPPVIYSEKTRDKLMFRIEATPETVAGLHPGLPVDVIVRTDKARHG